MAIPVASATRRGKESERGAWRRRGGATRRATSHRETTERAGGARCAPLLPARARAASGVVCLSRRGGVVRTQETTRPAGGGDEAGRWRGFRVMQGFKDGSRGAGAGTFGDQGRGDSSGSGSCSLRYLGLGGRAAACGRIDFPEYYIIMLFYF